MLQHWRILRVSSMVEPRRRTLTCTDTDTDTDTDLLEMQTWVHPNEREGASFSPLGLPKTGIVGLNTDFTWHSLEQ